MVVLETLGLEYEVEEMLPRSPQTQTADYLALNPTGKVPTLVDGDVVIFETQAILYYSVRQYGNGKLWADTPAGEASIWQWTLFISNQLEAPALDMLLQVKYAGDTPDQSALAKAAEQLTRFLPVLEQRLAEQDYLCGEKTFADIHGALVLSWPKLAKFDYSAYPAVERWLRMMLSSEENKRVTARMRR